MQNHPGTFIVLEGSDGSGKGTQFELLKKRIEDAGHEVAVFDFPRYDQPSSHFVKKYLNGGYGPAADVNPYAASLFYALDRYEASAAIKKALTEGNVVLANRYVGSNMAHQGAKFGDTIDKRSFFVWADSLEFQLLGIPRPTLSFYLRVPAEISYELISQKSQRAYTNKKHDEHEANINHLKSSVATYDLLCELFPKDFKPIECAPGGKLLSVEEINDRLWHVIQPFLPQPKKPKAKPSDKPKLKPIDNVDPTAPEEYQWQISGFSLRCLVNLKLRGLSLDINFDQSWAGDNSSYKYFTPQLKRAAQNTYKDTYRQAMELHKKIVSHLADKQEADGLSRAGAAAHQYAAALIPMGAIFSCNIKLRAGQVNGLLKQLGATNDAEMQAFAGKLGELSQKIWPELHEEDSQLQTEPESINRILSSLNNLNLPQRLSELEPAQLVEAEPKNEFDLLADGIFPFSDLSHDEIRQAVATWDYTQKARTLQDALSSNPDLLAAVHYRFDALADRASLIRLLDQSQPGGGMQTQQASVRYGYDVPAKIEAAGVEDLYMEAFDLFTALYNFMQSNSQDLSLVDYATLTGNKVRWQGRLSAVNLKTVLADALIDGQLREGLKELVAATHPIITEFITKPKKAPVKAPKKS